VPMSTQQPPRVFSPTDSPREVKKSPTLSLGVPFLQLVCLITSISALAINGFQSKNTAILGYVLTPVIAVSLLGLARIEFMNKALGVTFDRYGSEKRFGYARVLALVAFIFGLIHIWDLAWLLSSS